jgi:hypothetical protein
MGFFVKLFTIKGNLVLMNNLYHKVAVASVCTALGFALVANKEAKAATFFFTPTSEFSISTASYSAGGIKSPDIYGYLPVNKGLGEETRAFYEFNLLNLFLDTNTVIKQALLRTSIGYAVKINPIELGTLSYLGNGTPDISDFNKSDFPVYDFFYRDYFEYSGGNYSGVNFDVTNAIDGFSYYNEVSNYGYPFIGFSIYTASNYGEVTLYSPTLQIITLDAAEPVPEPITIFGSALALGVGGWLKRKNSSRQNKTTPQH